MLRAALYFAVATFASCVVTAFSLALFANQNGEAGVTFMLFLYFGFMTGSIASLVFAMTLTFVVRKLGPDRLWRWLLIGVAIALARTCGLARTGNVLGPNFNLIFCGPMVLSPKWRLAVPIGVFTALVCSAMHPWAFAAQLN